MSTPRGVPIAGPGMTGAIPGTDPLRALIAKEEREERKRERFQEFYLARENSRSQNQRGR